MRRLAYAVVYRTPLSTFVHVLLSGQSAESRERKARRRGWSVQVVPVHLVPIDPGQSLDPRALPEPDEAVQPRRRRRRPDALTAAEAEALEPIAVADLGAVGT
ncbi:hypothetical protein [Kineococcus rhizosphaerae]|uniref:hypothetical protein n=1 Tax=Kineococcus rhizosphaerae TaxID=559628 RepID=UPI000D05BA97|nr:hypothetical protein [Kineococcus rhizosphaerae]